MSEGSKMSLEDKIKKYKTIVYSRVVGWLAPTSSFNEGKAEEFKDRKTFKIKK